MSDEQEFDDVTIDPKVVQDYFYHLQRYLLFRGHVTPPARMDESATLTKTEPIEPETWRDRPPML